MATPFTRLLLATEHTEFDHGAETLALALAQRCALPLDGVMPLFSNAEYEMAAPELAERADTAASQRREQLLALARQAGVALDLRLRRGADPAAEILDEARARQTELLIIRRRGRRGLLAQLLVGEMVSHVVARSPCSVLVTPRAARLWQQRVLVGIAPLATDAALLDLACAVAQACGLPLQLVCVAAEEHERHAARRALDAALARAGDRGVVATPELRLGRPHQELLAAAQACGADLVVMGRNGPGLSGTGDIAQKLLGLAECPVLVHVQPAAKP